MFTSKIGTKNPDNYQIGRNVERRVCRFLDNKGWETVLSPGSRGPADVMATKYELKLVAKNLNECDVVKESEQKLCIQVKFRSDIEYHSLSTTEWHKLANHSQECNCIPIVATVSRFHGKNYISRIISTDEKIDLNVLYPYDLGDGYFVYFHNILDGKEFIL